MDTNTRETEFSLILDEEEIAAFTKVYKELKGSFRTRTQMAHIHVENDIWNFTVIGLTPRNWVTLCAFVYNELPDGEEVAPMTDEELQNEIDESEARNAPYVEANNKLDEEEAEQAEADEEEDPEETDDEPQRVVRKPVVVRKVGSNVTVESD